MSSKPICDIHSHLLPGIDDGAKNWDETLEMIRRSHESGVTDIIATPHYLPWRKTMIAKDVPRLCVEAMERSREELGIEMRILTGQELYWHRDLCDALKRGEALTLAGGRSVLVEFEERVPFGEMSRAFQQLMRYRYRVILAHCERYDCLRDELQLQQVLESGVRLQSNSQEVRRGFLDSTKRWLVKRYRHQEISFVGSDMHNLTKRPPIAKEELDWFERKLPEDYRRAVLYQNGMNLMNEGNYGRKSESDNGNK